MLRGTCINHDCRQYGNIVDGVDNSIHNPNDNTWDGVDRSKYALVCCYCNTNISPTTQSLLNMFESNPPYSVKD